MMWAIRIVPKPSWPPKPAATNSASSEEPITISGEAIGMKITRLATDRPWKRCRTRAKAIIVPRIVATSVARKPIWMLRLSAEHMLGSAHGFSQLSQRERVEPVDELALGLVEAHQDDHGDRDERVDEHEQPAHEDEVLADPPAQALQRGIHSSSSVPARRM